MIESGADYAGLAAQAIAAGSNMINNAANIGYAAFADYKSRQWQETMWQKQNDYNLPINQVARLKAAGINPNLAFGSSASALGTSVPSSPATHVPRIEDPFSAALAAKQALANVRRQNEDTRRERLNNDVTELLFEDFVRTKQAKLGAEYLGSKWIWEHGYDKLDAEMAGIELQNDIRRAEAAYTRARTDMTYQSLLAAKQEYEHLKFKYNFEDMYYGNLLNPYETNTAMGVARTFAGGLTTAIYRLSKLIKSFK